MDLENFKKNAKNKFVVINAMGGKRLTMNGTNLEETASAFIALMINPQKEHKYSTPGIFKKGEGVVIEGCDRETGFFSIYLMAPLSKVNNPNVARVIREFESED